MFFLSFALTSCLPGSHSRTRTASPNGISDFPLSCQVGSLKTESVALWWVPLKPSFGRQPGIKSAGLDDDAVFQRQRGRQAEQVPLLGQVLGVLLEALVHIPRSNMAVVKTNRIPFWGAWCTTHFRTYSTGDWDVHWKCDLDFDPWPHPLSRKELGASGGHRSCSQQGELWELGKLSSSAPPRDTFDSGGELVKGM